jgi:hypothetical protein
MRFFRTGDSVKEAPRGDQNGPSSLPLMLEYVLRNLSKILSFYTDKFYVHTALITFLGCVDLTGDRTHTCQDDRIV